MTPQSESRQYAYAFGPGATNTEGDGTWRALLGAKGACLAELARAGFPVPPGFTITTEACAYFTKRGQHPPALAEQIRGQIRKMEALTGRRFGDAVSPLLVSVRSGASVSMPGLMDSILNLGLNDRTVEGFIRMTRQERTGWDCYRRVIAHLAEVAAGAAAAEVRRDFESELQKIRNKYGAARDADLSPEALREVCDHFKRVYLQRHRRPFPQDPHDQLRLALESVFLAWQSERAEKYRRLNKSPGLLGAAVSVCAMVFGNLGPDGGAGVAFTRDGGDGGGEPAGEYLVDAQGEDIVTGGRAPKPIRDMLREPDPVWLEAHAKLLKLLRDVERHYRYPQEIEFTVERGRLWLLQSRPAKRSGLAGVRWAVEMAGGRDVMTGRTSGKVFTPAEALMTLSASDVEQLLLPVFDPRAEKSAELLCRGCPAAPGAGSGRIVLSAAEAEARVRANPADRLVLVRHETTADDIGGMWAARAVLTSTGGLASHAAVVARGMGRCCVSGAAGLQIDYRSRVVSVGGRLLREGDWISLDGSAGAVYVGALPVAPSPVTAALEAGRSDAQRHPVFKLYRQVSDWSDRFRRLRVRATADTVGEVAAACRFGADGIGPCRAARMLSSGDSLWLVREFLLAADAAARARALERLRTLFRSAVGEMLAAAGGRPLALRLAEPGEAEFLPSGEADLAETARRMGLTVVEAAARLARQTGRPFAGAAPTAGCNPSPHTDWLAMQARAIAEAACASERRRSKPQPEILLPPADATAVCEQGVETVRTAIASVLRERHSKLRIRIGVCVETPRAALTADELAESADGLCFGATELTRHVFGCGREEASVRFSDLIARRFLPSDPYESLDLPGVGQLIDLAVRRARDARPGVTCGLYGSQAADPNGIRFCVKAGLDFVGCAPDRVPLARLAAAQAAIRGDGVAGSKG